MDNIQILSLAFIQGFTEFLPISSSAHLILTPLIFGEELQDLAFDVAVHLGTLAAVLMYFRCELAQMLGAMLGAVHRRRLEDSNARLAWMIVFATLPVLILGWPLKGLLEWLRGNPALITAVIGWTTIGFGLLLGWADWQGRRARGEYRLKGSEAILIGLFQALAIIPGVSRSGITMTIGLFMGLTREGASRFSFLLAIPTILMAGAIETLDLIQDAKPVDWSALALGAIVSYLVAYLTIQFFLGLIGRIGMWPFVVYRLLLGAVILVLI
ncbi:undecaprenyl-diphosphate phosphatase [Caldichromatium japonicum]|uniref:Undecaprenyl-diphosphatase n=1 Tax=Caldichromatium japonicum TaxID=2699430 RepID=A0A6G7VEC7_9GAMM|nr:undecaprenyl-diphosphate phosphatase [Caldichromatium japonicum]QIK38147.1 undecaprenyl-diphosphate phosphatase [Caldichromatium japonicum]